MAYNASYYHLGSSTHLQKTSHAPPPLLQINTTYQDITPNCPPGYISAQDLYHLETLKRRTPSPTPSEQRAIRGSWRENIRHILKTKIWYLAIFAIVIVLVVFIAIYDKHIVNWLKPATNWLHDRPGGWVVPIAILFVLSFPPLLGHEIVAILCGIVWGLWIGFAIVAAGTLLGDIANYYVFKYWCRVRGEKYEKKSIFYGCLARVIRENGFILAVIIRLSAIPAHFTTTVLATCGMNIFVFTLAAILTVPKQLISVYIGVILEQSADGTETAQDRTISTIVLVITIILTVLGMLYINHLVKKVQPDIIHQRRKARQAKLEEQVNARSSMIGLGHSRNYSDATSYGGFSESDILLPPHARSTGSLSGLSQTTTLNPHGEPSDQYYNPYLELPQFDH